jgi:hypothetical protein
MKIMDGEWVPISKEEVMFCFGALYRKSPGKTEESQKEV